MLQYRVVTLKAIEIMLKCSKENGKKKSLKGHPALGISQEVMEQP